MLANGANISATDTKNWTALHLALAQNGIWLSSNRIDASIFHSIYSLGHEKVVKILLENGTDINAEEMDKWTPLHLAAQTGERIKYIQESR